jgi:long-chain fatty acid transport protein
VPHAYFVTDLLGDRVRLGFAGTVPFGLITDYDSDWVGRYHALRSIVRTLDFNPVFAVRATDWMSIGGGMSAQYASVSLSQAVFTGTGTDGLAKVSGTDWSYGWNLGVLFEPTSRIRGGIGFRSKVKHTLDGELRVTGLGPTQKTGAEASTTFPETVHGDMYFQVTDALGLSTGVRWTNWSRFHELRIRFDDPTMADAATAEHWHDNWMLKIGVDYAIIPGLVVRGGFAYDQTPIRSVDFRTPRIPDASRYWLATGLSYRPIDRLSVDVGYAHLFSKATRGDTSVPIARPNPGTAVVDDLDGEFSGNANIVGVSASFRF